MLAQILTGTRAIRRATKFTSPGRLLPGALFIVRDANGHALAYVYFEGMSLAGAQVPLACPIVDAPIAM
jgi:hypothetical protein